LSERSVIKGKWSKEEGVRKLRADHIAMDKREKTIDNQSWPETSKQTAENARQQAESIIQRAKDEAQKEISRARQYSKKIKEEARESGYQAGYEKGFEDGYEYLKEQSRKLNSHYEKIKKDYQSRITDIEKRIIDIVIKACGKVLNDQMQNTDTSAQLIKNCLVRYSDLSDITLMVSGQNVGDILERRSELEAEIPAQTDLLIMIDPEIEPGEFRLKADEGVFEGTVSDLTASLRRHMEAALVGEDDDS